jgi:hypothetical protein
MSMAPDQKNLLEAFRDADRPEPPSPPPARPPRPAPQPPKERAPMQAPAWLPWVAAVGIAFALGIVVGRSTSDVSEAATPADETQDVAQAPAGLAPRIEPQDPASNEQAGPREEEQAKSTDPTAALLDPANQYTVVVATYGRSRSDFAWATYDHLLEQGFQVFQPWEREREILILVGAAPTRDELRGIESRVRRLASWDGAEGAYSDAYVEKIDKLIDREEKP